MPEFMKFLILFEVFSVVNIVTMKLLSCNDSKQHK